MHEVFPVVTGAVVGFAVQRLVAPRLRLLVLIALSVVVGVVAAYVSGELAISWGFILVDMGQVLVVAMITMALVAMWQRRTTGA